MVAKKPDYEITCYTCFGFGNCTVAWDFDKDLWVRGMCPECKGTGEASAGQIEHLRCKFNPRSYTHVGKIMRKVGIPKGEQAINYIRHSKKTEIFQKNPNMTAEEQLKVAKAFMHSPVTSLAYIRKVKLI